MLIELPYELGKNMFTIASITPPSGYTSSMFGGVAPNVRSYRPGETLGPEGAVYFIAIPGLGSLMLEDIGSTPSGWGVRVNGSHVWTYGIAGNGALAINIDGSFTLSGGNGQPVSSRLVTNMGDSGLMLQRMYAIAQATPALQGPWQSDPMGTLYGLGFPRTCMINMDANCCAQFIAFLKTLPMPGAMGAQEELGGWFGCAICKIGVAIAVAALFAVAVATIDMIIEMTGGLAAPAVANLAEAGFIAVLAEGLGIASLRVAELAAAAYAAGAMVFLPRFAQMLCHEKGIC